MIERFGDSKSTLMTRPDHHKQEATETVRDYVDAMRLLFAKTSYPVGGQATKFNSGLNSKFRNRVQNMMPRDMDHAVEIVLYFEDLDIGSSPEKATATAKGRSTDSEITRLADRFDKLALSLTEAVKYGKPDNNGGRRIQSGNSPQQHGRCFHCKQAGHKSVDGPQFRQAPPQPVNHYAQAGGYKAVLCCTQQTSTGALCSPRQISCCCPTCTAWCSKLPNGKVSSATYSCISHACPL